MPLHTSAGVIPLCNEITERDFTQGSAILGGDWFHPSFATRAYNLVSNFDSDEKQALANFLNGTLLGPYFVHKDQDWLKLFVLFPDDHLTCTKRLKIDSEHWQKFHNSFSQTIDVIKRQVQVCFQYENTAMSDLLRAVATEMTQNNGTLPYHRTEDIMKECWLLELDRL